MQAPDPQQPDTSDFSLSALPATPRRVPMANALLWFRDGFLLLLRDPPRWLLFGVLYFIVMRLLDNIVVLGPTLSHVLAALIEGGLIFACARTEMTGRADAADFLAGFRLAPQALVTLGLISLASLAVTATIALARDGEAGFRLIAFSVATPDAMPRPSTVLLIYIVSILIGTLFFFATPLIIFHRFSGGGATAMSIRAALLNSAPLFTAVAINFIVLLLALLSAGLLFVVVIPWNIATGYMAYKDVFAIEKPLPQSL